MRRDGSSSIPAVLGPVTSQALTPNPLGCPEDPWVFPLPPNAASADGESHGNKVHPLCFTPHPQIYNGVTVAERMHGSVGTSESPLPGTLWDVPILRDAPTLLSDPFFPPTLFLGCSPSPSAATAGPVAAV